MRKGVLFGVVVLYLVTAWCWALALLGQYPAAQLPSGFLPLLRWSTLTLGLFGLTACGAWYVRLRGIRPRTMYAVVVQSSAATLVSLAGYWWWTGEAWPKAAYFLQALLSTGAVAFLWVGVLSLPRFTGWRRGVTLATAASIQLLAVATLLALIVEFAGNLDLAQALLLFVCVFGAGVISVAGTLCVLILALVQDGAPTEKHDLQYTSIETVTGSRLFGKMPLAAVVAAAIGLVTAVPPIPDPASELFRTLKALAVVVCAVVGPVAMALLAASAFRKRPLAEGCAKTHNARCTRRNAVCALLLLVLLLCVSVVGWVLTTYYENYREESRLATEALAAAEAYLRGNPELIYSRLGAFESLSGQGYEHPAWNITGARIALRRTGVFANGTIPVAIFAYVPAGGIHLQAFGRDRIYLDYGGLDHSEVRSAEPPSGQANER